MVCLHTYKCNIHGVIAINWQTGTQFQCRQVENVLTSLNITRGNPNFDLGSIVLLLLHWTTITFNNNCDI